MPDHSTSFEASGGGLALTNAILLYRERSSGGSHAVRHDTPAFASIHAVEEDGEGVPVIAAGRPMTRAHLRAWTEALGRMVRPEILPDNMLVAHPDMLVWWVPAKIRTAYFAITTPPKRLKVLGVRAAVQVPYPAHLFVATRRGLGVYALAESRRPDAVTPLLHSPILNVYVDGQLCWGNIPRPRGLTLASLSEFERAVFESWSTHPNPGQEFTVTGKGGLVRLWDDLADRRATEFPVKRLKRFGTAQRAGTPGTAESITVGGLIAAGAGR